MFRCLSGGSSGAPVDHVFISIRSGQSYTGDYTDAFSLNHRISRRLGLAGPPVLFSLNPSAGPTRQLHTVFLPPRETAALVPAPVRRAAAATPAPPLRLSARALHCAAARARPHSSRTLLLRRCSAAARAPKPRLCHPRATAHRRRSASLQAPASLLHTVLLHSFSHARVFKPDLKFSPPLIRCTQGVRGIAS